MKKLLYLLLWFIPLAVNAEPLRVFVSVAPQQTIVERLGGAQVVVEPLVKAGLSPHTYEPTPSQMARLARADSYIKIGMPFEAAWLPRIQAANSHMNVVDARDGIALQPALAHDHEDAAAPHEHAEFDPHIWTSPLLVKQMAVTITNALANLDSAHAADYRANLAILINDLDALDRDLRTELANITPRQFMVFHPAWGYFAAAYGLEQIPIELNGKEPSAQQLAALIDQARREKVRVIFVQPQFPRKAAAQIAAAIDGTVEVIDPLAADYFANLRRVARLIAEAAR
ncbi:ABC transporter substrate-binding protein [Chromatium weissei]|nr:ABC transporter substrate-binding protein [Chromatium weissei]